MIHWFMSRTRTVIPDSGQRTESGDARAAIGPGSKRSGTRARPAKKMPRQPVRVKSPLQVIPGVGPAAVGDFHRLGIHEVHQLRDRSPEALYEALGAMDGRPHDRCVLYVFRAAVYFASNEHHDEEKLKWWNWKDTATRNRAG